METFFEFFGLYVYIYKSVSTRSFSPLRRRSPSSPFFSLPPYIFDLVMYSARDVTMLTSESN